MGVDQHLAAVDATTFSDDLPDLVGNLDDLDEFLQANAGLLSGLGDNNNNNNNHNDNNSFINNILGIGSSSSDINIGGVGGLESTLVPTPFDRPHLHPSDELTIDPSVLDLNRLAGVVNDGDDDNRYFGQAILVEGSDSNLNEHYLEREDAALLFGPG